MSDKISGSNNSSCSSSTCSKTCRLANKIKSKRQKAQQSNNNRRTSSSSHHGWQWVGEPFMGSVFLNAHDMVQRKCYRAMRHEEGDIICQRDCVLIKSSKRKSDIPHVAKVAHLWENNDGEMMLSVYWYYRPQHVYKNKKKNFHPQELYASKHKDVTYAACIEDKCFVLSFNEYARFRKELKKIAESILPTTRVVPPLPVPRVDESERLFYHQKIPSTDVPPELVFFCWQLYDFIHNRTVRKPKFDI